MSTLIPVEVIAEALAKHHGGTNHSGDWECSCGSEGPEKTHEAHQASVIAALPDIAIVALPEARKKAQPVRDQLDLRPNNLPLLDATIPVAALDGIRATVKRWLTKRLEEGIAGSSYAAALEHCADELDAAIDMATAARAAGGES